MQRTKKGVRDGTDSNGGADVRETSERRSRGGYVATSKEHKTSITLVREEISQHRKVKEYMIVCAETE